MEDEEPKYYRTTVNTLGDQKVYMLMPVQRSGYKDISPTVSPWIVMIIDKLQYDSNNKSPIESIKNDIEVVARQINIL